MHLFVQAFYSRHFEFFYPQVEEARPIDNRKFQWQTPLEKRSEGRIMTCAPSREHMADKCPLRKEQAHGKAAYPASVSEEEESAPEAEFSLFDGPKASQGHIV